MSERAIRWSGLPLLIGGALLAVAFSMLPFIPSGPLTPLVSVPILLSSILLLLSVPAMYAKQANAAGWLGLIGHGLLQTGILLFVVAISPQLRNPSNNPPASEGNAVDFLLAVALTLGLILTAIVTIPARVSPPWAGILLLVGTAGFFLGFFGDVLPSVVSVVGIILLGIPLAFAWIGVAMLQRLPTF